MGTQQLVETRILTSTAVKMKHLQVPRGGEHDLNKNIHNHRWKQDTNASVSSSRTLNNNTDDIHEPSNLFLVSLTTVCSVLKAQISSLYNCQ